MNLGALLQIQLVLNIDCVDILQHVPRLYNEADILAMDNGMRAVGTAPNPQRWNAAVILPLIHGIFDWQSIQTALLFDHCLYSKEAYPVTFFLSLAVFFELEAVAQLEVDATRADSSIETMTLLEQRFESLWLEKAVVEHEGYEKVKAALRKGRVGFLVVYCGQLEKWEGNFRRVVAI
ncbi:uncharacterized protein PADG_12173 [Paracoccidioides brasiliensis Pb18]|uniref:Uncharacterized protein n=1 Tax=Paracoccidioides brasiliensis (strain Pb18) TaxID=502780 RepID=A0A0A0HWG9_PARBD|nr:uncharacterized protein PADG_12173 [Paracoccidioides brasiliensis Pb18]KGM91715.1 hypothetical protein PADG_12173 [Paracoccidioides brasiliensis Pb18]